MSLLTYLLTFDRRNFSTPLYLDPSLSSHFRNFRLHSVDIFARLTREAFVKTESRSIVNSNFMAARQTITAVRTWTVWTLQTPRHAYPLNKLS